MKKIWSNLQRGLKNYCAENGFDRVILGLSGGLDSAITAVLAADALGGEKVKAVMMKTRYTSDLSLKIARETAVLNKLDYQELDIEPLIECESAFLKQFFDEEVQGVTAENLQARLRGQLLMAYSNQYGGLVLACGNKSEALTGYCTLYGDTCGGLAPIGNLYKTTIFELAKWRNSLNRIVQLSGDSSYFRGFFFGMPRSYFLTLLFTILTISFSSSGLSKPYSGMANGVNSPLWRCKKLYS